MKTGLFIALGLCLINLSTVYGQSATTYRFGISSGLNATQIQRSLTPTDLTWQYNAGGVLEQKFSPVIAIAYEILYSRQGSSLSTTNALIGGTDRYIIAFDYASIPVILRFRPKGERAFVELGGQIGYLLNAKSYYASNKEKTLVSYAHTNKVDAGLTGGIGYRFGNHFVVDLRYFYGMNPILANYSAPDPQTSITTYYKVEKWYNRVSSLNIAYYF